MRITTALLGAAFVGACGGAPIEAPDVVRTDSAGVRIVTSGAVDKDLPWRFDSVGVLTDSLGEPWFVGATFREQVLIDRAGRTYLLTADLGLVRFGRDGRFDRTIGRMGSGPGEFKNPVAIAAQGDTLVVMDVSRRSLVRFSSSLDPIAERRLDGALSRLERIAFRAGGFWYSESIHDDTGRGAALRTDTIGGAPLQRVVTPHGDAVQFRCFGIPQSTPLFAPGLSWAASGPRIIVNAQPSYALRLYEGTRLVAMVRRPLTPRAPTVEDVREIHPDGMRIVFGGELADRPGCVIPVEEMVARQGMARRLPLVEDVQLFADGTIWTQRSRRGTSHTVVDVFGSDGAYSGSVRGMQLPLGRYPNGDLLLLREDAGNGELLLVRVRPKVAN